MSFAASSALGSLHTTGAAASHEASGRARRQRLRRRHDVQRGSSIKQSYYPPGFSDENPARTIQPALRVQPSGVSYNRRGGGPFVGASHAPGWLPRQVEVGQHPQVAAESTDVQSTDDMFQFFLDRFERPISAPPAVQSGKSARARAAMSSSRAERSSRIRNRAASRTNSQPSSLLLSQLLGSTQSSRDTTPDGIVPPAEHAMSSGSNEDNMHAQADIHRASPRTLCLKLIELERAQREQDGAIADLRRENLRLKREAVDRKAENSALDNEVARLSQNVVVLTEDQLNKAAEIKAAMEAATGSGSRPGRNGLGRNKSDAEFARLKELYATTEELQGQKPSGYDPWGADVISTFEARDSMAEVLSSVKEFLSTVESEQFISRQMRDEAYHFAHSLDLHKLKEAGPTCDSQRADGSWKSFAPAISKQLIAAREADLDTTDIDLMKGDGRRVRYAVDLKNMWAVRKNTRPLRARERSEVERAACILSTIMGIKLGVPSCDTSAAVAAPSSVQAALDNVSNRLATGHTTSLTGTYQFIIRTEADHSTGKPPESEARSIVLDLSVPPGRLIEAEMQHPTQVFNITAQQFVALVEQLTHPNQTSDIYIDGQPASRSTLASAKSSSRKGKKKAKSRKVDGGASMVWEECLENGAWELLPENICRELNALRERGTEVHKDGATVTLSRGPGNEYCVDLRKMVLGKRKKIRFSGDGLPTGTSVGVQFGPEQWAVTESVEISAKGKKGKKGKSTGDSPPWFENKVPQAWLDVLRKSKTPKDLLSEKTLCTTIWEIFDAKVEADKADDLAQNPRDEMDEFVFEFFLFKFGLYTLAVKHMVKLVGSLLSGVGADNPVVQLFRSTCYLNIDDPDKNLTRDSLDLILILITHCTMGKGEPLPECEPHNRFVPASRMRNGLRAVFSKKKTVEEMNAVITKICENNVMMRGKGSASGQQISCVPLSEGMEIAAHVGRELRLQREEEPMRVFSQVDDGDGVLDFAEFEEAVRQLLPEVAKSALPRMYREALEHSNTGNPNALTPAAFTASILQQQGYSSHTKR